MWRMGIASTPVTAIVGVRRVDDALHTVWVVLDDGVDLCNRVLPRRSLERVGPDVPSVEQRNDLGSNVVEDLRRLHDHTIHRMRYVLHGGPSGIEPLEALGPWSQRGFPPGTEHCHQTGPLGVLEDSNLNQRLKTDAALSIELDTLFVLGQQRQSVWKLATLHYSDGSAGGLCRCPATNGMFNAGSSTGPRSSPDPDCRLRPKSFEPL